MHKKSQAAMEFMTTHGWAVIMIFVVGIAIYFFWPGVPQAINFGNGIIVPDYSISIFDDINSFVVIVQNGLGREMIDARLYVSVCNNNQGQISKATRIKPGETQKMVVMCRNADLTIQEEQTENIVLTYNTKMGKEILTHKKEGIMQFTTNYMMVFEDTNLGRLAWALDHDASGKNDANRFIPCGLIPGCNNPSEMLLDVFDGYVDSTTGKVWYREDFQGSFAVKNGTQWDSAYPVWNGIDYEYEYEEGTYLGLRDDSLGSAFDACGSLSGVDRAWKLPSANDFNGLLDCESCLPPLGTYPTKGVPYGKWYWTEDISDENTFATCIHFVENTGLDVTSKCTKSEVNPVRCIRDD